MKDEPIATTFKCFVKGATRYINNDDVDVSHALFANCMVSWK